MINYQKEIETWKVDDTFKMSLLTEKEKEKYPEMINDITVVVYLQVNYQKNTFSILNEHTSKNFVFDNCEPKNTEIYVKACELISHAVTFAKERLVLEENIRNVKTFTEV